MIKKIIFILFVISLLLLAGCKQKAEPIPANFSTINPDKAVGNVIKNTDIYDCAKLKTEAQRTSCMETIGVEE